MTEPNSTWRASRPGPALYFMDAGEGAGLLPYAHVDAAMASARNYWVATSGPDGRPHAMPVWGVWRDDCFVFSTSAKSRKARHLDRDPRAVVHLESGEHVVILEGRVETVRERAGLQAFIDAYNPKYDWSFTLEEVSGERVYAFRPEKAFGWLGSEAELFRGSATRWRRA